MSLSYTETTLVIVFAILSTSLTLLTNVWNYDRQWCWRFRFVLFWFLLGVRRKCTSYVKVYSILVSLRFRNLSKGDRQETHSINHLLHTNTKTKRSFCLTKFETRFQGTIKSTRNKLLHDFRSYHSKVTIRRIE